MPVVSQQQSTVRVPSVFRPCSVRVPSVSGPCPVRVPSMIKPNTISKFAFLGLLLILAAVLLRLSATFIHAIIIAMLLGSVLFPLHRKVSLYLRNFFRVLRRWRWSRFSPGQALGRLALRCRNALQAGGTSGICRRIILSAAVFLSRHLLPPPIQLAREIVDRRKKLAAGLSVALIVMLVAFPVVFFFHSAFIQGKQLVNRGLRNLQSGEMANQINKFYEDDKTQQTLKKIQDSSTGKFLLQQLAEFLDSPELFSSLEPIPGHPDGEPQLLSGSSERPSTEAPKITQAAPDTDELSVIVDLLEKNLLTFSRKILSLSQFLTLRAISAIWGILFSLFLMVIVLFFVFYKGRFLLVFFRQVGPFAEDDYQQICDKIGITAHTVFVGIMGAALVQGLASMVGFWLTGLPALFLAVLSAACSIIPFVGTALVWFPSALYLFFTGHPQSAIFLCAWGILLVGNIDGIVRPWLMSGGKANLSFGVLFFSILGGLRAYGLIGIIYGPMLIGIFITVMAIFAEKYKRS